MRILYSHRIQSHDGQAVHLEELISALRAAGHEVLVVGPRFYAAAGFGGESRTVALARRLLPGAAAELAEIAYNLAAWRALKRAAAEFRPDVIYERYNLFYLAGAHLARASRLLYYLEVNAPLAAERSRFGTLRLRRLAGAAERYAWRSADRLFAVTEALKEEIAASGVPAERISVVPNGVDLTRFPRRPPRLGNDRLTLGFIGFLRPWHHLESVIRGLAGARPDLSFVIAGEGPAKAGLERLARALGCEDRVHFLGLTERAAVPDLLAGVDIALQPHALVYASPLKLFEYMAAGLAIVAPDQANIRAIVAHEQSALLFDPERPEAMWEAIARLAADPELRLRLGQGARAEIERRDLTWRGNAVRITALATRDLDAARGRRGEERSRVVTRFR